MFEVFLPLHLHRDRHLGEAVAGQIDQPLLIAERKKIQQLRAPRGFAGAGEFAIAGQCIDGAGLASVRAAGEGDLGTEVSRALAQGRSADQKARGAIIGHCVGACIHRISKCLPRLVARSGSRL
jgi:hypothetical protein